VGQPLQGLETLSCPFFKNLLLGNTWENGQNSTQSKTVGSSICRYRLGRKWVAEMLLNVQSKLLIFINFSFLSYY
jgi:hypothetical protein